MKEILGLKSPYTMVRRDHKRGRSSRRPQVVIPQHYDQHYWAGRVHQLGIGTVHAPGTPTTDSLTSALKQALEPDMTARAQTIATAVRSDGAQVAAQRLITAAP